MRRLRIRGPALVVVGLAGAALVVSVVVGTTGDEPGQSAPRAGTSPQPSSSAPTTPQADQVPRRLVQPRWAIKDVRRIRGPDALPALIGPEDALGAPSLLDAPLPGVVIAMRDALFVSDNAWPDGDLALLGTDGTWRSLSQADLGLANEEMSFSLSADGSLLAVSDRMAVQVVDVATGRVRRYPVPFQEPIGLQWTDGDRSLHLEERGSRPDQSPLLLDLRDGSRQAVPYSIFGTDFTANGTPVELRVSERPRRALLLVHHPRSVRTSPRGAAR